MQLLSAPHSASDEFIYLTFSPLPLPVLSTWPWWPGWSPCACCFFAFAWPSWCSDSEPSCLLPPRRFGTPALHSCRRITSWFLCVSGLPSYRVRDDPQDGATCGYLYKPIFLMYTATVASTKRPSGLPFAAASRIAVAEAD